MLKRACLALLCAVFIVQCQAKTSWPKVRKGDSHGEPSKSSENDQPVKQHRRVPRALGKVGPIVQGDNRKNDEGATVDIDVQVDETAQRRPPQVIRQLDKVKVDREGQDGENTSGKLPKNTPRPESNRSRPDGDRPVRPEYSVIRPNGQQSGNNSHDPHRPNSGNGPQQGSDNVYDDDSDDSDDVEDIVVNVNVNIQVNQGNGKAKYPKRSKAGHRHRQTSGGSGHRGEEWGNEKSKKPGSTGKSGSPQSEKSADRSD